MAKNETSLLLISVLVTLGLIGGGLWLIRDQLGGLVTQPNAPANPTDPASPVNPSRSPNAANPNTTAPASNGNYSTFAQVENVPQGLFSYGGSTTWAPIRSEIRPVIQAVWPGFNLRYTDPVVGTPGSGTGIDMLLNDQLSFSQSSRPLKSDEYEAAEQRGFTLQQVPVAIDGIAIAVNPDLNIPGLTLQQVQDIYRSNITNWSQVGGPNLPITPFSRDPEAGGTVEFFISNVLQEESFGSTVELVPTTTQALRRLSDSPGGIYYASAPEVVPQCTVKPIPVGRTADQLVPPYQEPLIRPEDCPAQRNQLNNAAFQNGDYSLTRRLFVIIKQNGQQDQQAGEAYAQMILTDQGQDLIEQAGFVRIR
jgi:phosphate transport system substrate-binding protein